jgi:DNA (cytosine-5)-methyltransferase 1
MATFVSLFAGIGGFDLGLERAGHVCVGQVEIDKKAQAILTKHWPTVPKHDDVQTAKEWADEQGLKGRVDIVCGGFPCQDVSVAGRRAGLAGRRTGLFFDALAFASHVEAETVILENVPGLLSSNEGRDFGVVLSSLADAGYRYIEWRVLNSQFFGVPQRRRRVFIVASTRDRGGRQVLFESDGSSRDHSESGEAGEGPAGAAQVSAGVSSFTTGSHAGYVEGIGTLRAAGGDLGGGSETLLVAEDVAKTLTTSNGRLNPEHETFVIREITFPTAEVLNTIPASLYHHGTVVNQDADAGHLVAEQTSAVIAPPLTAANDPSRSPQSSEVTAQIAAVVAAQLQATYPLQGTVIGRSDTAGPAGKGFGEAGDPMYTLDTVGPHGVAVGFMPTAGIDIQAENERTPTLKVGGHPGVMYEEEVPVSFTASEMANSYAWEREHYPTLTAQAPSDTSNIQIGVRLGAVVRRLTPVECERLQGFDDNWTDGQADSSRYKQLGNAVTVNVIEWLGHRLSA